MDRIKEKFAQKAIPMAAEIKELVKQHGNFKLGEYTIEQVYRNIET